MVFHAEFLRRLSQLQGKWKKQEISSCTKCMKSYPQPCCLFGQRPLVFTRFLKRRNFLISFWILLQFSLIYLISINFKLILKKWYEAVGFLWYSQRSQYWLMQKTNNEQTNWEAILSVNGNECLNENWIQRKKTLLDSLKKKENVVVKWF